ncbi:MAG: hypothetical protein AABM40_01495 [Chloroflexota bacterium]
MGTGKEHAVEAQLGTRNAWWMTALYWFCWIALVALATYGAFRAFGWT